MTTSKPRYVRSNTVLLSLRSSSAENGIDETVYRAASKASFAPHYSAYKYHAHDVFMVGVLGRLDE